MLSRKPACSACLVLLLTACASTPPSSRPPEPARPDPAEPVPREEPRSKSGNPPFYEVFGKRYFVLPSSEGYVARGVASWYGPGFHGRRTANGERYDMHAMTAAHTTLPLPCYVQVTNLSNGRSVVVRVNDRGPFHDNRLIDLSRSAAEKLDMIRNGTALVEVRALSPGKQSAAAPSLSNLLYVQAGAFSEQTNAQALAARLRAAGVDPVIVRRDTVNGRTLYRVRVGPVPSVGEYDRLIGKLRTAGIANPRLALD